MSFYEANGYESPPAGEVCGEGEVFGEAGLYGEGEAGLYGEGEVSGEAELYGEGEAGLYGEGEVFGEAELYGEGEAGLYGEGEVFGEAGLYGEGEMYGQEAAASPLGEVEEANFAAELMAVQSEQEMDQFLGRLVGRFARSSPVGRALGGILRQAARRALPVLAGGLGSFVIPGAGSVVGARLGSALASTFESEAAGLDPEQQQYEVARRFVRVAANAARQAAQAPPGIPPAVAAQRAVAAAARGYLAPGMLGAPGRRGPRWRRRHGRWVRRGNAIIVFGAYR
jgi:hypothetical protein